MSKNTVNLQKLNPATIPLSGRHLIEASAGTGKTYNITRLYLRLLLEKGLSVQQILVMTFTKAATEELRGRIEEQIRLALNNWNDLINKDKFFSELDKQLTEEQSSQRDALLNIALRELDEASIYTIHGFCSRALSSQAFASGLSMDMSMEMDTSELLIESVRDWLRKINQSESDFALLEENNCHTPEGFTSKYGNALTSSYDLQIPDQAYMQSYFNENIDRIMDDLFYAKKTAIKTTLLENESRILEVLVKGKNDEQSRHNEWAELILWLESYGAKEVPAELAKFINGNRYRGNDDFKALFEPLKLLKNNFIKQLNSRKESLEKQIESITVYRLITLGVLAIRKKFSLLKEQQMVMDFDDLITYLSNRLQDSSSQALKTALSTQYPVALVDEFQDTDPQQYAILDILYPRSDPSCTLFMIGDPKQAVYAFRGGDIFTYLKARNDAEYHWYMDTNWRSEQGVVTGYNRLFLGKPVDEPGNVDVFGYDITYNKINSTPQAKAAGELLKDPDKHFSAINYCWLQDAENYIRVDELREALAQWCVSEISRLLTDVRLGEEAVQEKDIAILVRTGTEAQIVRDSLSRSGFPSVYLSEKDSIFKTDEARELLLVLNCILELENDTLLIAALSTYLMGGNAEKLAQYNQPGNEQVWEEQRERAAQLRDIWFKKGCISMLMELTGCDYQPEPAQHERSLTNMIHLAELLQQASRQFKHPQQLLKWFMDQCHNETRLEEAQLRLESDANLIRIVTQHGSKGLEYPIVFIPFASSYKDPVRFGNQLHEYFEYHDPENYEARCQLGASLEAIDLTTAEGRAESIRLLYVAITRAAHRCYLGIAPFDNSIYSPLGLTLKLADDGKWEESLQTLVNSSNGSSALIHINEGTLNKTTHRQTQNNKEHYTVSRLSHPVDSKWSLSSFSSLIRDSYTGYADRLDQKEHIDDEAEERSVKNTSQLLRFALRKGADTGNLLHDILEHTNFNTVQHATQEWPIQVPLMRFGGLSETEQDALILWLQDCLDTSLPPIEPETDSFKLSDFGWSQTLRETEFYFPLDGVDINKLCACLEQHRNNGQKVRLPGHEQLQGMMRGFIDLIFEHRGRFYVADYKSTHLGDRFENYHWQALRENNQHHFYDLQYLIYSLALHRYLRFRIPDYNPDRHFGGVYYLYLRAMSAQNPQAYGVYHTAIDAELLNRLDTVFKGIGKQETAA